MKRILKALLGALATIVCGVAGIAIAIATAPADTTIDEGWKLSWIGLAGGLVAGVALVATLFRRNKTK